MQKNVCLIEKNIEKCMSDFKRETDMLPEYTPRILCDGNGRVLMGHRFPLRFTTTACLLSDREVPAYLSRKDTCDSMVFEMKDKEGKDYLVLSKADTELTRGIVCSFGEKDCIKLSDYYEKLCSYKDYLDSFSSLVLSRYSGNSAISTLEARISGVASFLALCTQDSDERRFGIPLAVILGKTAEFVRSANENPFCRINISNNAADTAVSVPMKFVRVLVSCLGIVLRYSKNGCAEISVEKGINGRAYVKVSAYVSYNKGGIEIYEDAVVRALNSVGVISKITKGEHDRFDIEMLLESVELVGEIVSEADEATRIMNVVFADPVLYNMCRTVMDCI